MQEFWLLVSVVTLKLSVLSSKKSLNASLEEQSKIDQCILARGTKSEIEVYVFSVLVYFRHLFVEATTVLEKH